MLDVFGTAVAISGNTIVVSGYGEDSSTTGVNGDQEDNSSATSFAAYVFVRNGATWVQQAYLKASNNDAGDFFGYSVAVSVDTIVVGAINEASKATGVNHEEGDDSAPEAGAAYVFVRDGTTWTQQAYLKASNTDAGDRFSYVSVSGDTLVVGADLEASHASGKNGNQADNSAPQAGAAYVFVRSNQVWTQRAYLKATVAEANSFFGFSVAISGNAVLVGAYGQDVTVGGVGAAYVYPFEQDVFACDGTLDSADALAIFRALAGLTGAPTPTAPCTGDYDESGDVNLQDVVAVLRQLAGMTNLEPQLQSLMFAPSPVAAGGSTTLSFTVTNAD
ncbi:hypothetical protein AYO38_05955 [bacterium SCGC AG-212-C10]|nr:hypothetical protein AYO38_05955 [bacterium SCGC AG-212-C10]